jgi:hypothetical protein
LFNHTLFTRFAGPERGRLFNCACASRVCCFVATQVFFTAVQLVWLAGDAVPRTPVRSVAYGASAGRARCLGSVAGELRQLMLHDVSAATLAVIGGLKN